jgi:hypothetical protein
VFELIGMTILQVILLVLGTAAGVICHLCVSVAVRGVEDQDRKRDALRIAFFFPLVAVFYFECGFLVMESLRTAAGYESRLAGQVHYALGNGYNLTFHLESGPEGWIEVPQGGRLDVDEIHGLQVDGDILLVRATPSLPRGEGQPTVTTTHGEVVPSADIRPSVLYIELNTRTHTRTDYVTAYELGAAAEKRGTTLQFVSPDKFYREAIAAAAPGWFALVLLFTPLTASSVYLLYQLQRLRKPSRSFPPDSGL